MAENNIIVAFELGSSKIAGIAAQKNPDGSLKIRAYAFKDSSACIRKGTVSNVDKTVVALKEIKQQLENTLHMHLTGAYVGLCGLSMHSERNTIARQFGMQEEHITTEIIEDIIEKNSKAAPVDEEILNAIIQEYQTGTGTVLEPVGVLAHSIQGNFLNIVARTTLKARIQHCFDMAGIPVLEYFVAPEATATAALNAVELRSGCALVDIGAEMTTVAIYHKFILRYLRILPLGSAAITRDLCNLPGLAIEEEEAERIKRKYGTAIPTLHAAKTSTAGSSEEEEEYIPLSNGRSVSLEQICTFTAARAEEIIANVWEIIKRSGYESEIVGGIVLTGGGANLQRIDELMQRYSKRKCHIASTIRSNLKVSGQPVNTETGVGLTLVGLLHAGSENCCEEILEEEPIEPTDTSKVNPTHPVNPNGGNGGYETGTNIKGPGPKEPTPDAPAKPSIKQRFTTWLGRILDDDNK